MSKSKAIDVQGHRGCRGELPENTLLAFERAINTGVTTLEMDLVISKDKKVVVSHEPFFNHQIATGPGNAMITEENEKEHNLYQLDYEQIKKYDVGLKPHPRFANQRKAAAVKPQLREVFELAETKAREEKLSPLYYNIEIKRRPEADNIYHPELNEFVQLVIDEVQKTDFKNRIFIQSFDIASLQRCKEIDPDIQLVLLIENRDAPQINLDKLGFIPDVYSPSYQLINEDLVSFCKKKNMKLIPWTVNENDDMLRMLSLGVDGIISDFPTRLIELINSNAAYSVMH